MEACDVEDCLWRAYDEDGGELSISAQGQEVLLGPGTSNTDSVERFRGHIVESLVTLGQMTADQASDLSLEELVEKRLALGYDPL